MAYCTQADLIGRYGEAELTQLTDREQFGGIDAAVLATAIADADAEIDGYLSDGGYPVPLESPPYLLTRHACVIARAHLYADIKTEEVKADYAKTLAWLERIASGAVRLPSGADDRTSTAIAAGTRPLVYGADFDAGYAI